MVAQQGPHHEPRTTNEPMWFIRGVEQLSTGLILLVDHVQLIAMIT